MLSNSIAKLVQYGIESGLTPECERSYTINLLLDVFHEDEFVEPEEKAADVDLTETNMTGTTIASTPAEDKISYTNTTSGAAPVEGKKASYTTAIVTNNVAGTATVKSKLLSADVTVGVASADTAAKIAENIAAALNKDTKFSTTYKASTNGSSLVIEQSTAANTSNFTTDVNFSLTFE